MSYQMVLLALSFRRGFAYFWLWLPIGYSQVQLFLNYQKLYIFRWGGGEKVDAADLKSAGRKSVWVRIPPALLSKNGPLWAFFISYSPCT